MIGRFARLDFFPFQVNLAVIHGHLGNRAEARDALDHMFALWPEARQGMHEILDFWFPYEDLAAIFADGLTKAGSRGLGIWTKRPLNLACGWAADRSTRPCHSGVTPGQSDQGLRFLNPRLSQCATPAAR